MQVVILKDDKQVALYGANLVIQQILRKPDSVLGLATGSSPVALYNNLIEANQKKTVSFSQVKSFNLDEYLGLPESHPQSYRYFMQQNLFDKIDIQTDLTSVPPGKPEDPYVACDQYEEAIKSASGIDLQILGIGGNGHIGFNEPSSSLASRTRVKTLTRETIQDNARFFNEDEVQPTLAITMGIGTIMESRHIILLATGKNKQEAVKSLIEGPVSASCPASALQFHPHVTVICDTAAAEKLEHQEFYNHMENQNQQLVLKYGY